MLDKNIKVLVIYNITFILGKIIIIQPIKNTKIRY